MDIEEDLGDVFLFVGSGQMVVEAEFIGIGNDGQMLLFAECEDLGIGVVDLVVASVMGADDARAFRQHQVGMGRSGCIQRQKGQGDVYKRQIVERRKEICFCLHR